jgi:CubicO group peptidase (beta-lactamase class C family)
LVSTVRDYARFGAVLLGDGALDGTRVMKVETARAARSNLLPDGVLKATTGQVPGCGDCKPLPGNERGLVSQNFASWNQIVGWLRRLDAIRRVAFLRVVC